MARSEGPYRGGKVHVLDDKCSTCIFRPGNLMHLRTGKVKAMVDAATGEGTVITCHQTLVNNGAYNAEPAVCRGFYDGHAERVPTLELAQAMGIVVEDPQPTKREAS